jgi:plastocyanin
MKSIGFSLALLFGLLSAVSAPAQELGSIEGQFLLEGAAPNFEPLIAKGADVKDAKVCAAEAVPDQKLVVDPATGGIANVFVYLRRAPANMPAELKTPKTDQVVFDQKNCVFIPHAMTVRVGQTVLVKSDDDCAHNIHSWPLRNYPFSYLVKASERDGVPVERDKFELAEQLPIKVTCDIHPWMQAYWLILDHPYMAVTDAEGKFTIKDLPAGEHTFYVWQESAGYVDRAFTVTVDPGKTTKIEPVKVGLDKFKLQ